MQAVILAAGLGTRMGDLTRETPKPLLKIEGKTILEHNLQALPDEISEVIIVIGYLGEQIRQALTLYPSPASGRGEGEREGKKIIYVEQKELKGTGHALFLCKDILNGRFLVFYGDDLYGREDLAELVKHPLAILVSELKQDSPAQKAAGTVQIDENGITQILERQEALEGALVNTGAYVLNTDIFKYPLVSAEIPPEEYGLPQTFMQMIKDGAKIEVVRASSWRKVTTAEDLSSLLSSRT